MIPNNRLSSIPVRGTYLPPYNRDQDDPFEDWAWGGTAIEDANAGLLIQIYRLNYDPNVGQFVVTPESFGSPTVVYTQAGASRVGLSFDQLMRPVLMWLRNGDVFLRWFDTVPSQMVVTNFGDAVDARVILDDPRGIQTDAGTGDVLLFYVKDGRLFYRQQRDRFLIERELATFADPMAVIRKYGRTNRNRIEFEVRQL